MKVFRDLQHTQFPDIVRRIVLLPVIVRNAPFTCHAWHFTVHRITAETWFTPTPASPHVALVLDVPRCVSSVRPVKAVSRCYPFGIWRIVCWPRTLSLDLTLSWDSCCYIGLRRHQSQGSHSHWITILSIKHESIDPYLCRAKNLMKKDCFSTENDRFENQPKTILICAYWQGFRRNRCPPNVRQWSRTS